MSLNAICYKHIKDTFHYGIYGDFKLVIDKRTDCFNATKLCDMTGKHLYHWTRLAKSKELIEYYKRCLPYERHLFFEETDAADTKSCPPHLRGSFFEETDTADTKRCPPDVVGIFYEIKEAQYRDSKLITGTYLCKELLLSLATWISNDFYHKCSNIVNHYFVKDFKDRAQALQELIISAEEKMEKLCLEKDATIAEQKCKIDELMDMMRAEREKADADRRKADAERALAAKERKKADADRKKADADRKKADAYRAKMDAEYKKADEERKLAQEERKKAEARYDILSVESEVMAGNIEDIQNRLTVAAEDRSPKSKDAKLRERFVIVKLAKDNYYIIRGQDVYCNRQLQRQAKLHPSLAIIMNITYQPNSRNLFIRLKDLNRFTIVGNHIMTDREHDLCNTITQLHNEKHNV